MDPDRCKSLLWLRLRLPLGPCLGHGLAIRLAHPSTHSTLRGNPLQKTRSPIHRIGDCANPQKFGQLLAKTVAIFGEGVVFWSCPTLSCHSPDDGRHLLSRFVSPPQVVGPTKIFTAPTPVTWIYCVIPLIPKTVSHTVDENFPVLQNLPCWCGKRGGTYERCQDAHRT